MKLTGLCMTLLICVGAFAVALEQDDPAIVGAWLFDGNADDASGNGNNGEIIGDFSFETGKYGDAIVASGGGSIDVADSDSIASVTTGLTVAAWFRIDEDSDTGIRKNGAYLLEDQSDGEPIPNGFSFRVWTSNGISPGLYGQTELEQEMWHHIAGTYDGATIELYVNGEPESAKGALDSGRNSWEPNWSGDVSAGSTLQLKFGSETLHGAIDEVVILNRALDADEIAQLMTGWDQAFTPVEPKGKLATTWSRLKATQ